MQFFIYIRYFSRLVQGELNMAEEKIDNEELRIGVYVCHCGVNIGGVVDCPEVAEYAKTLPNVVYATVSTQLTTNTCVPTLVKL